MSLPLGPPRAADGRPAVRATQIVVISSVMFAFISYWRTAAIVLCDMSSTVFYIGAIAENAIGKAAPWFILAVLLFAYGMRAVYIESCALFVRGGVYRVVKEAMGGFLAKLSVSALLFDYVLTGPISGVCAGQYIVGLALETLTRMTDFELSEAARQAVKAWGAVVIASCVTLYFLRQNLVGIHESSRKALRIMIAVTVMGVIMVIWASVTLAVKGPTNSLPQWQPNLEKKVEVSTTGEVAPKIDHVTGEQQDPLGLVGNYPHVAEPIRHPANWLSIIGVLGLVIAFGHSILAMSGEETLAQVYREVESPKLANFKKVGFIVFAYSLLLTGSMNFFAVMIVPDHDRMTTYYDNWIGGLAMNMIGPAWLLLLLNAFVVVVGFLILSGAVNTSIVGSNGVLSRVAEDGVLPDWFLRPHARYGTNYRQLYLIAGLQLVTIVASGGDVILLGEAYAFGVVWSFVFKTLSMVILRFKKRGPREFLVPFNIRIGDVYFPIGLGLVVLIVLAAALANLFTKPVATASGICFTAAFLTVFMLSEYSHRKRRGGNAHEHIEQFNRETIDRVTAEGLNLNLPYCKLVAIRSPHNLFMLDKALADADPQTTEVVVMTAKVEPRAADMDERSELDSYDQHLLTAVVSHAEQLGKSLRPLLVPTNNALYAVLKIAKDLPAQEVLVGASNKYSAEEQLDQIAFYWIDLHSGRPQPLTIHIVSEERSVTLDLHGGNRIPKAAESYAKTVDDLRMAGIGVRRLLFAHDGTPACRDAFEWLLTMVSSEVEMGIVPVASEMLSRSEAMKAIELDQRRAEQIGRAKTLVADMPHDGPGIVQLANQGKYDVVIFVTTTPSDRSKNDANAINYVLHHAPCPVFLAHHPTIPRKALK